MLHILSECFPLRLKLLYMTLLSNWFSNLNFLRRFEMTGANIWAHPSFLWKCTIFDMENTYINTTCSFLFWIHAYHIR